jgi:hypothetical protein
MVGDVGSGSSAAGASSSAGVAMTKKSIDVMAVEGQMAVKLIDSAAAAVKRNAPAPMNVNPLGTGLNVDTYA